MGVDVRVLPTIREAGGLAMSSRNRYLSADERQAATVLYKSLCASRTAFDCGERKAATLRDLTAGILAEEPKAEVQYLEIVDPVDLDPVDEVCPGDTMAMAVFIGKTRLIDNAEFGACHGAATTEIA